MGVFNVLSEELRRRARPSGLRLFSIGRLCKSYHEMNPCSYVSVKAEMPDGKWPYSSDFLLL